MRHLAIGVVLATGAAACGGGGDGPWQPFNIPGTFDVTALWAFAPDDVWAGGQMMLHYDGTDFKPVGTPMPTAVADFWGFAPNDLYAVSGATLLHWDGAAWTDVDFAGAISPSDLTSVWGSSRDDLWLGDSSNGRVFRWNGTAWSTGITQVTSVNDLWGVAGGPVYAGGVFGIARWSGTAWTDISDSSVASEASGVWGAAADDVWAVGDFTNLAHWDGAKWTDTVPANNDNFNDSHQGVWGTAADDVWAVGDSGAISHWNGTAWSQTQYGKFPYYPYLSKVHGSSPTDIWVAGRTVSAGPPTGLILHLQQ
jgi:hypothetical protein